MILPFQRAPHRVRAKSRCAWFLFLLPALVLTAAERPVPTPPPEPAVFVCGNRTLTTNEILQGRYPDADFLNVPDACKQRARQMIEKWRKDDLTNIGSIFEQACSAQGGSYERLLLDQGLVKAERETELQSIACDCYSAVLSRLTNAPAAPTGFRIASQSGLAEQKAPDPNQVQVRYSPGVAAKRAEAGITLNAEELSKSLSPKQPSSGQQVVASRWIAEYQKALGGIIGDARRVETLAMELGPSVDAKPAASSPLPGLRQKLAAEAGALTTAFDGLTREHELPRGECPEAFAIRHQVLLQFLKQLTDSQGAK